MALLSLLIGILLYVCNVAGSNTSAIVNYHNAKRAVHGANTLVWSPKLASLSSNSLSCANVSCTLSIDGSNDLTQKCLDEIYGANACMDYSTGRRKTAIACRNVSIQGFVRMVWKPSVEVGCATSLSACPGKFVLNCLYRPRRYRNVRANVGVPRVLPVGLNVSAIERHNQYRALHKAPPLEWNFDLERVAQQWADRCIFEHSNNPYGENLAMGHSSITHAIDAWYGEVKDYTDYRNGRFGMDTGHFTQVVWVGTKHLGCAKGNCPGKPSLWVCVYNPPGNYYGQFSQNVLPPEGSGSTALAPASIVLAVVFPIVVVMSILITAVVTRYVISRKQQT